MFEQTLVDGRARTSRGWPVLASLFLQVTLVCSAILIPLMNPELLPRAVVSGVFLAPVPPPPPRIQAVQAALVRAVAPVWDGAHLLLPRAIPARVAMVVDEAIGEAVAPGSPGGGVPGGMGNPFLRNLGQQWQTAPPPLPPPPPPARPVEKLQQTVDRIVVSSGVQEAKLLRKVSPRYPALALQTRVEGKVQFSAVIGKDGTIQALQLVGGHPLLVGEAAAAVRQWLYRPTLLNGEPVEVATTIEVRFILNR